MTHPVFNGGDFIHDDTELQVSDRVMPLFSLKNKTAIVTGAASGIGFAVVQALAEAGANVAFTYNNNMAKAFEGAKSIEETYKVQCRYSKILSVSHLE
jgi:sorbose reductase